MSREARKRQRKARRAEERQAELGPSPEVARLQQEVADLGHALEEERAAKHAVLVQLADAVEGRRRQVLLLNVALLEQQRLRNLADLKKARVAHLEVEVGRLEDETRRLSPCVGSWLWRWPESSCWRAGPRTAWTSTPGASCRASCIPTSTRQNAPSRRTRRCST